MQRGRATGPGEVPASSGWAIERRPLKGQAAPQAWVTPTAEPRLTGWHRRRAEAAWPSWRRDGGTAAPGRRGVLGEEARMRRPRATVEGFSGGKGEP